MKRLPITILSMYIEMNINYVNQDHVIDYVICEESLVFRAGTAKKLS